MIDHSSYILWLYCFVIVSLPTHYYIFLYCSTICTVSRLTKSSMSDKIFLITAVRNCLRENWWVSAKTCPFSLNVLVSYKGPLRLSFSGLHLPALALSGVKLYREGFIREPGSAFWVPCREALLPVSMSVLIFSKDFTKCLFCSLFPLKQTCFV